MNKLAKLTGKFEDHLSKAAGKSKPRTSRKQILKKIDKSKADYQVERKRLDRLNKQKEQLDADITSCQEALKSSRSDMLNLKKILSKMDLADCNYVILYDEYDCGYVIDGEEFNLSVNDDGDLDMQLMKDYRREKRLAEKDDNATLEENKEEPEEEEELVFPNLRFLD